MSSACTTLLQVLFKNAQRFLCRHESRHHWNDSRVRERYESARLERLWLECGRHRRLRHRTYKLGTCKLRTCKLDNHKRGRHAPGCRKHRFIGAVASSALTPILFTILHTALFPGNASAAEMPPGFRLETLTSDLDQPVAFAAAANGKFLIAEKSGVVRVFTNGQLLNQPFIDLSGIVNDILDRGLLSVAVHPDFPATPYVYVAYSYDPPQLSGGSGSLGPDGDGKRVGRLDRITADSSKDFNVALSGSRTTILGTNSTASNLGNAGNPDDYVDVSCQNSDGTPVRDCLPADSLTHTLSFIKFDRNGMLIVSNGDGASYRGAEPSTLRTQDLNSLAGKIIRIDPITGDGLPDNPYYNGNAGANISKVLSLGLRNPFRFALHPQTDEMFIGDVGWGTWEEVNRGTGNFGWPCYEGGNGNNIRQSTYGRLSGCTDFYSSNRTITAPAFAYNHNGGGAAIQMGDFLASSRYPQQYRNALLFNDFTLGTSRIAYFDSSQNLERVDQFGSGFSGTTQMTLAADGWIYATNVYTGKFERLRHENDDVTIVAVVTPDDAPDSDANSDAAGGRDQAVFIQSPPEGSYEVGSPIELAGYGTQTNGANIDSSQLRWTVDIHHNEHVHSNYYTASGASGAFDYPDHGDNSKVVICLALVNTSAVQSCRTIYPRTGILTINSEPQGLTILFSTAVDLADPKHRTAVREATTPAEFKVNIGGVREIRAIDNQQGYQLTGWSTGETTNPVAWTMPYGEASISALFSNNCGSDCPTVTAPEESVTRESLPVETPTTVPDSSTDTLVCIDVDGDGWGWDGEKGCLPNVEANACVDYDGDGYGWDGEKTCLVE